MPQVGGQVPAVDGVRPARTVRALVVEDEQPVVEALGYLLGLDGFVVEWAPTGPLALLLFARTRPDLVLLDLMLPGLDGLDVCREIRRTSDVPVIMVTARDRAEDRARGLQAGADDYVTKPYSILELRGTIHRVLDRRQQPVVVDPGDEPDAHLQGADADSRPPQPAGAGPSRWSAIPRLARRLRLPRR